MSREPMTGDQVLSPSDDYVRRSLQRDGIAGADIERIISARARLRAEDQANGRAPRMSHEINASLKELGTNIRAYKESTEQSIGEVSARMQHVEQIVAKIELQGDHPGGGFAAGPSVGAKAMKQIAEDGNFAQASEQAARNMRVGRFESRVNLDTSIRAALTNDGKGQEGDTGIPSRPEVRGYVPLVTPRLRLIEALPARPTSFDAVEFVQLNATGDAAEQVKEGDVKAELDVDGDVFRAEIVTIAAWSAASKQVLSDHLALGGQISQVIWNKVLSKLEDRLINGVGGTGRINGLINQATPLVPAIASTAADSIGEAATVMATQGYNPTLVVMSPLDWFRMQITKKNDTDEEYVFGSPTAPLPQALWNTRVVTPAAMPAGSVLVLDTAFVNVLDREQINVAVTNTHADFFVRNLVAILGELRAGLEVLDRRAVLKLTLPAP
ncbi:phage major capsid protein [Xanthomonas nasturtii]|uniref:Phage major capsid protein n=1 Tax=Xanthomonas nasturtii TaxID=1843581 RepID=A0ABT0LU21_9XANT|nr:phage major capsid protein [Xanthomonas nasturtii]MCL1552826.1 phage major capsid protein [Xanthomonas nasturtii]MCL1556984.1 phage major capsid protein [Xanthomonas nasturtii]MCL1561595.1 phage major capsid protein [Xanthomonas nasturtii]